ncbi:MAG: hypothetical protein AB1847_04485 [bacterium]
MNPYRVLKIPKDATRQEIMQAVPLALQRKEFTAREIADAQKELMNPCTRKIAEFVYFLDSQTWTQEIQSEVKRSQDEIQGETSIQDLPLLHCFDKFQGE